MLLQMSETWVPNLWKDNQSLINISTGEKASTDFIENFKTRYDRGTVGMNEFFKRMTEKNEEERTIPEKSYYDPIKKQKLAIFGTVVRSAVFTGHLVYACVIVALISRSDNSLIMRRELASIH